MSDKTIDCRHVKVYADFTYTTNPPVSPWICSKCGLKGEDRGLVFPKSSYQELVEKFRNA
jgi:hypothetical protein